MHWTKSHIFSWNKQKPLIAVLHIEVVTRPYVMSNISYFIVRTFDVKHHAAHGTILINFGSEKRSYVFLFSGACGGLRPLFPHRALDPVGPLSPDPSPTSAPPSLKTWIRACYWSYISVLVFYAIIYIEKKQQHGINKKYCSTVKLVSTLYCIN